MQQITDTVRMMMPVAAQCIVRTFDLPESGITARKDGVLRMMGAGLLWLALSLFASPRTLAWTLTQPDGKIPAAGMVCQGNQQPGKGPRHFRPEQFKKDLQEHITKQAGLNSQESRRFFPVFFEMKDKLRNLDHQKMRALRRAARAGSSESDCERVVKLMVQLERKRSKVYDTYMERLAKTVDYRKLVKACEAEQSFGRKMFRQMTGGNRR